MGGGLMQLVAYGAQDIYLTGNPQITFFKVVYRRHTNFSMESIQQTWNGGSNSANGRCTATISRNGDLVHKLYFQVDTIIIGRFGSIEDAGFHQNAVRLAVIGMMNMEVTNQVFQPALVDKYINDRQSFSEYQRQIQRFFAAFSLLICVFLIFFSIPLLELIYGTEYLGLDRFVPFVCFIFMI